MADFSMLRSALLAAVVATVSGCGQKGPLYLPDAAGEVVTRPAATPPESETTSAPNSPRTPDSLPAPSPPAPEVSVEEPKKEKGTSPPPPR
jgi:predicted small lipoprotein YifL